MPVSRIFALLGMARRAGNVAPGSWAATAAVAKRSARALILAADAGRATDRRFRRLAAQAEIPIYQVGTRLELGRAIGLEPKAVLAVTSAEFAKGLAAAVSAAEVTKT